MKKNLITLITALVFVLICALGLISCGIFGSPSGNSGGSSSSGGNSGGESPQPKDDSDGTFIYTGASVKAASTSISGDIVIPSTHNGSTIDTIPANAFKGCFGITSITVPDSVTSIGASAFNGCSMLKSITLPFVGSEKGNTSSKEANFGYVFGESSYQGGTRVTHYYSSNNTAYYSYYIPSTLRSVTITNESRISYGAFQNCSMLTSIKINASAQNSVGSKAFENTVTPTWN